MTTLRFLAVCIFLTIAAGEISAAADGAAALRFSSPEPVLAADASVIRLTISPDGTHQLWGEPRGPEHGGLGIRERHKSGAGWGDARDASFNTRWNDFDPAFAADGSGIYFFSDRPGGAGGDDIWFVPVKGAAWGEPVNIGFPVNTSGDEWAPTPLADGRLLFSSDRRGGLGAQDLYIAEREDGGFATPQNLGVPVNSASNEYDAAFLEDGALVFTRSDDPESGSSLFYSCRSTEGFTAPQPAGPNVNLGGGWALGPSVSAPDRGALFFSGRDASEDRIRIYRVRYESACSPR